MRCVPASMRCVIVLRCVCCLVLAHAEHHYSSKVPTIRPITAYEITTILDYHTTQIFSCYQPIFPPSSLLPPPHSVAEAPPLNKGQFFFAHLSLACIASSFALVGTAPLHHNLPTAVGSIKSHGIHSLWSGSLSLLRYSQEQQREGRGKRERVRMRGECLIIVCVYFILILKTGTLLPWP